MSATIEFGELLERSYKSARIEALAELVVCVAKTDTTLPNRENPQVGWRTDQLLGEIDKLVIYQHNDPVAYAEIARRALKRFFQLIQKPEMVRLSEMARSVNLNIIKASEVEIAALLHLAIFRGERLLPVDPKSEQRLSRLAQDLEKTVAALPEGIKKRRCQSLFDYHRGVFYNAYGRFADAAASQRQSAEVAQANGDKPGAAIGYFLQAVYQLKDALCQPSTDEAQAVFSIMEERYAKLVEAVSGTSLEVSWGQGNGPSHMIEACVWLNQSNHPSWDSWVTTALAAAEKLGRAFKPGADFVRAADLYKRDQPGSEAALQAVADDVSQINEVKAAALLILARCALSVGGPSNWPKAHKFIAQIPEQGAQHVRAVATRLSA